MAKQLNVNLAFKADTTQVKQQLQQLQTQLNNLTTSSISQQLPITPKLQEAQNAAINLKIALQQSMNVDTGKFDLTKFNNSLKRAGTSLNQMRVDLNKFGPEGQQAFMTLAQSIMQAEVPMRRTNALLAQLGTTLKNTAKWQISSMALHGFMSAISGAYGYAQDLNESLNNIRIVTEKNIDDMGKFAQQANKAAKALSTTTTAYTDASLIYYQQGLTDEEVLQRADVTVKMANATGQAAEVVSDQMTAIWNNFYDGSKALEYYSDVVTALGAATASSSDEIAEGLEKFAAVADTVGLSYEYATSALATVTATTRQSADVVGTAFKTLFARIQDLELGKTLDDGTTLGAYAESLQAVGINIKESNGELKKMDNILNEMGSVWKTLGNDQQAALAQSVAGVRQYTQLMALMENWDYFKDNLEVAKDATGTLQEQADIYAESWEAAQKRVQASAQAIYQDLISDEFFIDLQNNFADFLDTIDKAIDGMGGLKGVVALLGGVLLTAFSGQAARGLENMAYNIKMMTAWGQQEIMQTKELAYQEAKRISNAGYVTEAQQAQASLMKNQLLLQNDLVKKANVISDEEKQRCQAIINENKLYGEQYIELVKIKETLSDTKSNQVASIKTKVMNQQGTALSSTQKASFGEAQKMISEAQKAQEQINKINTNFSSQSIDQYRKEIEVLANSFSKLTGDSSFTTTALNDLMNATNPQKFRMLIKEFSVDGVLSTNAMADALDHLKTELNYTDKDVVELVETMHKFAEADNKAQMANKNFESSVERSRQAIENARAAAGNWADTLVGIAGGISSLSFAISSLSSIGDVFNNEDMSAGEKFLQITMSLSMALPMLINGLKSLRLIKLKELATTTVSTVAKIANAAATKAQAKPEMQHASATQNSTNKTVKNTIAETANTVVKKVKSTPQGIKNSWQGMKDNWNMRAYEAQNPGTSVHKNANGTFSAKGKQGFIKQADLSAAGKQSAAQLGKMAGGVALIAAAIAVVAGTITLASAQWNKAANEAKKTAEEATKLSNEFSNAQNQYSELKDTISNYQEGVKGLQELTKGTTEYTEAMIAANEEASKLIDQYGLTNYTIEDGLIKISEAELNAIKAAQLSEVSAKQRAAADANIRAKEAENEANRVKFNRETGSNITAMDAANTGVATVAGGAAGALAATGGAMLAGATIGSSVPIIGTFIGAAVGLIAGGITAAVTGNEQKKEQEAIEGLAKLYENDKNIFATDENLRQALKEDLNIQDEDLIEELVKNRESTKELISSIDENNKLIQAQRATAMASYLQGDKTYQNSEYQDQIANILSKENENSAYTKALKEAEDVAWKGTDKNIHKAYAEYMGYEFVKDTNSGTGKFKDAQGNEVEIDDETMVEFLTNEYARQEAAKNVEEVSALLDSLTNISSLNDDDMATAQSAIADFIAGDNDKLLALSDEQMDAVNEQLKNGISLTDEEAQMLGYDNAKAFTEAFDKQFENWSSMSAEQRAEKMAAIKQQEFDSAIASTAQSLGVSSEALKGYTKALQNANPELQDNSKAAIAAAKANINFSKGVAKLDEALKDNLDILQNWNEESFETYEAAGKVQAAVKEMFGVDVSTNFIRDNLEELQELTKGNTENFDELREAAAKDFIVNLGLEEEATNALDSALDALINQDREGIKIGAEVDLGSSVDQLNQFLKDGTLTAEQVTQAFNAIGYEPEIGYITDEGGQTVHQSHEVKLGGTDITLAKLDSYTTSDVSVPYIKSSTNKDSKGKSNKSSATKTTSTSGISANLSGLKDKADKDTRTNKTKYSDEIERYHELQEAMEDLENEADKLSKAKERAFGADKLALMDQEIAKQKEILDKEKEYQKEIEDWYSKDRKQLLDNYAVELDSDGRIINYDEIYKQQIDRLNSVGEKQGWDSEAYEKQKEAYEKFKTDIENYEESLNLLEDQQQAIIDKQNELADLALEKIEFQVQIKVDAADDDLKYIEFLMQTIEDDAFAAADAIGLLGQEAQATFEKITATEKGIAEVMATIEEQGYITDKQAEFLREARDELINYNAELLDLRNTVHDKLTEAYDAWNEKLQENTDIIDHYSSIIENYKNIIDIVGKDNLGISDETLAKMREAQVNNANDALRASKATLDANKETLAQMEAARETATNPEDIAKWDEQIKNAQEKVREATEEFMGNWETALQTAADAFAESVEQIVETFSESVSGIYKNLDELQEAFDRQKETDERYLDTYEKTYEISKLNRQIAQSIDKTTNVGSQKELRDLQKQLLAMNEAGVEVSQRDIEYMQKKYDLMIAEQAFRDAQNAKSVVRLQRDSEGNFGYVYTADQNTVDSAQQNYEDKLYAIQKFGDESLLEIQEQIIATNQEFADALLAIQENSSLSTEQKKAKAEEITQYYTEKLRYWTDEANDFMLRGQELNETYNANMASNFHNTLIGQMYPNLTSFQGYYEESTGAMGTASEEFTKAVEAHEIRYDKALQLAGTSTDKFENTVKTELEKAETESSNAADSVEDMAKDMNNALNGNSVTSAITAVKNFQQAYSSKFSTIRQENLDTIISIGNLISKYQEMESAANKAKEAQDRAGTGTGTSGTNTKNTNGYYEPMDLNTTIPDSINTNNNNNTMTIKQFGLHRDSTGKFQEVVQLSDGKWYNKNIANGKNIGDKVTTTGPLITYDEKNIIVDQDPPYEVGDYVKTNGSVYYYSKSGNGKVALFTPTTGGSLQSPMLKKSLSKSKIEEKYTNPNTSQNYYRIGQHWYKEEDLLSAYDTGGYTGEWGPEGRLAMLHQKEIVLNAHDTENFLSAIGIVRDISDQIEKNALTMQYRNTLNNYNANINKNRDILEQNVHITAEFPNATNHTEIEEAFRNLSNLASQYANRKF